MRTSVVTSTACGRLRSSSATHIQIVGPGLPTGVFQLVEVLDDSATIVHNAMLWPCRRVENGTVPRNQDARGIRGERRRGRLARSCMDHTHRQNPIGQDCFGDTAEQQMRWTGSPVTCHDNTVCVELLGGGEDLCHRTPRSGHRRTR